MSASAGISVREFARRDGCDEKLVRRALQKGKLSALSDGTLDASLVGTGWRKSARRGDEAVPLADADTAADAPGIVRSPESELSAVADKISEVLGVQPDAFMRSVLAGNFASTGQAERVKENALALKHLLDGRQKANALIDRETAEAILFEAARAARDSWMNWPVRIGPLLAADLGHDAQAVTEALIPYVHKQLDDLGEPDADFTAQPD